MKKFVAMLLASLMVLSLAACGSTEGAAPAGTEAPTVGNTEAPTIETKAAEEVQAAAEEVKDYSGRKLRLIMSIGGGGNWWQPVADRMKQLYPGLDVEVVFDSNADQILRTEYLAGEAADAFMINSNKIPRYQAIQQGLVQPIDYVLSLPTMDGSATLADVMDLSVFGKGAYEGHYYCMHEFQYLDGFWYDAKFFRDNNLTIPETWEDFQKLCEECKALGIPTVGYMGIAADEYANEYWFIPMLASTSYDAYVQYQNLDPEVWKSDAMKRCVEKLAYVRDNGYFDKNTLGTGASETQIAFINHEYAIYPCGSWLEPEMADAWTEDWELTYLPYSFGEKAEDKYMMMGGQESMITSSTKENLDLVGEFYRVLFSDEEAMKEVVKTHQNVMLVPNFSERFGDLVAPSVNTAAAAMEKMNKINSPASSWYPDINKLVGDAMNAFFNGDITEEEFLQRGYDEFTRILNDSSVTKYKFEG